MNRVTENNIYKFITKPIIVWWLIRMKLNSDTVNVIIIFAYGNHFTLHK